MGGASTILARINVGKLRVPIGSKPVNAIPSLPSNDTFDLRVDRHISPVGNPFVGLVSSSCAAFTTLIHTLLSSELGLAHRSDYNQRAAANTNELPSIYDSLLGLCFDFTNSTGASQMPGLGPMLSTIAKRHGVGLHAYAKKLRPERVLEWIFLCTRLLVGGGSLRLLCWCLEESGAQGRRTHKRPETLCHAAVLREILVSIALSGPAPLAQVSSVQPAPISNPLTAVELVSTSEHGARMQTIGERR